MPFTTDSKKGGSVSFPFSHTEIYYQLIFSNLYKELYDASKTNEEIADLFKKTRMTNPWYIFDNTTDQDGEFNSKKEGKKLFFFILKSFGNCFVNHKEYSILVQANSLFSEVATVSDEAFGYFTLERCWDSWRKFKVTNGEEQIENEHSVRKSNTKFGGWKQSGPKRYSEIAKLVKISRNTEFRKGIEEEYKKQIWEQNSSLDSTSKPTKKSDEAITFVAYNDLDEDEEDENQTVLNDDDGKQSFDSSSHSDNSSNNGTEKFFSNTDASQTFTTTSQQRSSQEQNRSYVEGKINEREIFDIVISFISNTLHFVRIMLTVRITPLITSIR